MFAGGLTGDRDFLKLWGGQAISKIGSTITSVGMPLTAALVLGASPLQMGFLAGASGAGVLVFGLFAGASADRLPPPHHDSADLARAALLVTIPIAAHGTVCTWRTSTRWPRWLASSRCFST